MASITYDEAAHLLRRMAFGGSPDEINDLAGRGREGAVDFLINYDKIDNKAMEDLLEQSFDFSDPRDNTRFNQAMIRRWWFTRMVTSRRQFEEKMTLFWHNHFATALSKVQDIYMFVQNNTLRDKALGRFDDLLLAVAQDAAMLIWLDGITNVLGSPNENWARELQELFTMGITDLVTGEPNYTEQDVKEIARAFTGWKFNFNRRGSDPFDITFFINAAQHDNTSKTIYGQTLNFTGEDVITVISARQATARFLVSEFFEFFVYPLTSSSGDKKTIDKFASVYLSSNHSIKELARAVFVSDEFFSDRARFTLVKQPSELVVGAIRMLGATYNPGESDRRGGGGNLLFGESALMGQDMFNPPDVNGWDLNLAWINTSAMLERFNYTNTLVTARTNRPDNPGLFVETSQLAKYTKSTAKATTKKFLNLLGPLKIDKKTRKTLQNYLSTDNQGNKVSFENNDATIDTKVRGLVHQIMCLPEFQLN